MLTSKVIAHFGGNLSAVGRAAGCSRQAVQQWGMIVPERTAWVLHQRHPQLKFREEDYADQERTRRERIRLGRLRTLGRRVAAKKPPPPEPAMET